MIEQIRLFEAFGSDTPILPITNEKDYVVEIKTVVDEWVENLAFNEEAPTNIDLIYLVGRVYEYYKFLKDSNIFEDTFAILYRKTADYNSDKFNDPEFRIDDPRENYFPFGDYSYIHMILTKAQRIESLFNAGGSPNFEGKGDSLIDLAAYLSFYYSYLLKQEEEMD